MKKDIVLGAGLTGITYASKNKNTLILEKETDPGGLCRSRYKDDFIFDYSGHLFHSQDQSLKKHLNTFTSFSSHTRKASVHLNKKHIPVPIQNNISFLPPHTIKQAIADLPAKTEEFKPDTLFYIWCEKHFGNTLYSIFFKPYNIKFWGKYFKKINSAWTKGFITYPDKKQEAQKKELHNKGYNATFMYPENDGIGILAKEMVAKNDLEIKYNTEAVKIDIDKKNVTDKKGNVFFYQKLINTTPLPELKNMLSHLPDDVDKAFSKLKYVSVLNLNIALNTKKLFADHWIYFPEKEYSFYRIGCYSNFSKNSCRKNHSTYYIEKTITSDTKKTEAATEMIADFINLFDIDEKNIVLRDDVYIKYAYVVFDNEREQALKTIENFLNKNDIYLKGRYGAWNYSSMSESLSI